MMETKRYLWAGPTQVGKSSSIKLITRNSEIVCGAYG